MSILRRMMIYDYVKKSARIAFFFFLNMHVLFFFLGYETKFYRTSAQRKGSKRGVKDVSKATQ